MNSDDLLPQTFYVVVKGQISRIEFLVGKAADIVRIIRTKEAEFSGYARLNE